MKRKLRIYALIFVMTAVWIMPVSFSAASDQQEKVKSAPVAQPAAHTGASISVSPKYYALNPCEKRQFTAEVKDAKGRVVSDAGITWTSTHPEVAFIDDSGNAVAISPGATIIRPVFGKTQGEPASLFVRDNGADNGCYTALEKISFLNQ